LIERVQQRPYTQLKEIVEKLREKLSPAPVNLSFDDGAANELDYMLTRLAHVERELLPRRKQRALEEMEAVLRNYSDSALREHHQETYDRLEQILAVFEKKYRGQGVDWDALAEKWLDLVRPAWYARLLERKRLRPLVLREIRSDLMGDRKLDLGNVFAAFESIEALPPIEERVVSCIIGVAAPKESSRLFSE